ncbi:FAST kinase domain-containing protein 3, mitochondrial-like [Alosa sapidissima]|uniref:FAST kinase domain-containing protein 3, mitochondrial-like n=1 Tax=Alosa sapidissima TaxID=34773 RepID=UPI001C091A83|nr:FAST kinase domain-containing protein 3, mitochondrial-like [Alosa sapidissima]
MNSISYISTSVRTVGKLTSNSACRRLIQRTEPYGLCTKQLVHVCNMHMTHGRGSQALQFSNVTEKDSLDFINQIERYRTLSNTLPTGEAYLTHSPANRRATLQTLQSFNDSEMWNIVKNTPNGVSISGLATLMGICVKIGMDPDSPTGLISKLKKECLRILNEEDVPITNLCLLGEVVYSLEGASPLLSEVLKSVSDSVDVDLTPLDASHLYTFFALIGTQHIHPRLMTRLNRCTERLAHRLPPTAISNILHSLAVLQEGQSVTLISRLIERSTLTMGSFSDAELSGILRALARLSQYDAQFLYSLEHQLVNRIEECDPDLISSVMEYCLHVRWCTSAVFEAVAERFVQNAEMYSTTQIAQQIVAMGRLNYLPSCASEMFKKLESILTSRFSQFQPRTLLNMLHSCIHLERFPLNFVSRVFSSTFLQRLEVQGHGLDKKALAQLTQLSMCTSLECTFYQGPKLPYHYHMKKFPAVEYFFESPLDRFLFRKVHGPLCKVLGGRNYFSTRVFTQNGYTVDVEICLDEEGLILPLTQWDQTHKRIALCLDGPDRFCTNTHHLLGKEVTKRRHLQKLGFVVIQIPYFEYEILRTQRQQTRYLHQKISHTVSEG